MSEKKPEIINNPALYRRLCEPFPSIEAANDAIQGFNLEVRALREKYKIADVCFVISGNYINGNGEESAYIIESHHGDALKAESLLAWAFGKAQGDRQDAIQSWLRYSIKRAKKGE